MENVRVFCFCSFLLFVGRGKKKKMKLLRLSTIPVVFKRMPVLNVHISYGPDDDFLGGTGKSGLPLDEVGVLRCPPYIPKLCRALPAPLNSKHPLLHTQEPENRQGVGKNAQKWDFMDSRGRPSRQPAALGETRPSLLLGRCFLRFLGL